MQDILADINTQKGTKVFLPVKMAIIFFKKQQKITSVDEDIEKLECFLELHCQWECKMVQPLQKMVWWLLRN